MPLPVASYGYPIQQRAMYLTAYGLQAILWGRLGS